jgi:hypothetical protein
VTSEGERELGEEEGETEGEGGTEGEEEGEGRVSCLSHTPVCVFMRRRRRHCRLWDVAAVASSGPSRLRPASHSRCDEQLATVTVTSVTSRATCLSTPPGVEGTAAILSLVTGTVFAALESSLPSPARRRRHRGLATSCELPVRGRGRERERERQREREMEPERERERERQRKMRERKRETV